MNLSNNLTRRSLLLLVICFFYSSDLLAHKMAPSLLQLEESQRGIAVLWKTPLFTSASINRAGRRQLQPQFPSACVAKKEAIWSKLASAWEMKSLIDCPDKLLHRQPITIINIENNITPVILRYVYNDGSVFTATLNVQEPTQVIPEKASVWLSFLNKIKLGLLHFLTGWDHMVFILCLLLLIRGLKPLLYTVTSFTVGHSLTLFLAVYNVIWFPRIIAEVLIALSIMLIALDVLAFHKTAIATFFQRHIYMLALVIGLVHGLGFANAVAELSTDNVWSTVLGFNLGIEIGQCLLILAALILLHVVSKWLLQGRSLMWFIPTAAYLAGGLSTFFLLRIFI